MTSSYFLRTQYGDTTLYNSEGVHKGFDAVISERLHPDKCGWHNNRELVNCYTMSSVPWTYSCPSNYIKKEVKICKICFGNFARKNKK